jgi:hypothetical protein
VLVAVTHVVCAAALFSIESWSAVALGWAENLAVSQCSSASISASRRASSTSGGGAASARADVPLLAPLMAGVGFCTPNHRNFAAAIMLAVPLAAACAASFLLLRIVQATAPASSALDWEVVEALALVIAAAGPVTHPLISQSSLPILASGSPLIGRPPPLVDMMCIWHASLGSAHVGTWVTTIEN